MINNEKKFFFLTNKLTKNLKSRFNCVCTGNFTNDKMNGEGEFVWNDGMSYKGDYINDVKEGHGVFIWPDGKKYDGEWLHGKQHGDALFTDVKGKAKHCVWKNGEFEKWK